ncbi:MAG TPA: hypothetical protein VK068_03835 [Jeotgalicoccus sp.]|nr:hypothetical protein [Jeotgalicoccus sp.]
MYDYKFIYKTSSGKEGVYIERFNKELSNREIFKEQEKIFNKFENVESVVYEGVFKMWVK